MLEWAQFFICSDQARCLYDQFGIDQHTAGELSTAALLSGHGACLAGLAFNLHTASAPLLRF